MRFVFSPPADTAAGLLTLPWRQPLEDWDDDRMLEIPQRGISRHVVRFVRVGEHTCAVTSDGKVWCWGENDKGQLGTPGWADHPDPTRVPGVSRALSVRAGHDEFLGCARCGGVFWRGSHWRRMHALLDDVRGN